MNAYPRIASLALLLSIVLGGCATAPASTEGVAFVVVRHAEKASDGSKDPPLTSVGLQRAQRLAQLLADTPLSAVYATEYRRTQQTAQPSASARRLTVRPYEAEQSATEFAAMLRSAHPHGEVLVVGHSNTVPGIVAALCGCTVAPIGDDDYGNVYRVRFGPDGAAALDHERY